MREVQDNPINIDTFFTPPLPGKKLIKILTDRQEGGTQASGVFSKWPAYFKGGLCNTAASVNTGFSLNPQADCQSFTQDWWITASEWFIFWFAPPTNPTDKVCGALWKWASVISCTASCQSCRLHIRVQKGEKHKSLEEGIQLYCHKNHIIFLSPFKTIKIAYLFLPV